MSGDDVDFGPGGIPAPEGSPLDRIRRLRRDAEARKAETVVSRPTEAQQFAITYRVPTRIEEVQTVLKATRKQRQTDPAADDRLILVRACQGISLDGQRLNHLMEPWSAGDEDATFAAKALQDAIGASDSVHACTLIYRGLAEEGPGDGDLSATAADLLRRGGLTDAESTVDIEGPDPTTGS